MDAEPGRRSGREAGLGAADRAGDRQSQAVRGLTFQRPDKWAVEQDPEAVRAWLEETWLAIWAKARAEGGEMPVGDQVGIRSDRASSHAGEKSGSSGARGRDCLGG